MVIHVHLAVGLVLPQQFLGWVKPLWTSDLEGVVADLEIGLFPLYLNMNGVVISREG